MRKFEAVLSGSPVKRAFAISPKYYIMLPNQNKTQISQYLAGEWCIEETKFIDTETFESIPIDGQVTRLGDFELTDITGKTIYNSKNIVSDDELLFMFGEIRRRIKEGLNNDTQNFNNN